MKSAAGMIGKTRAALTGEHRQNSQAMLVWALGQKHILGLTQVDLERFAHPLDHVAAFTGGPTNERQLLIDSIAP